MDYSKNFCGSLLRADADSFATSTSVYYEQPTASTAVGLDTTTSYGGHGRGIHQGTVILGEQGLWDEKDRLLFEGIVFGVVYEEIIKIDTCGINDLGWHFTI